MVTTFQHLVLGFQVYIAVYVTLTAVCFGILGWRWRTLQIFTRGYWRFILTKTKIGIYLAGTAVLLTVALARPAYPYWDVPISIVQPLLAFFFAPWSVAVFCKKLRGESTEFTELYVAVCLMLFTAAWAVEVYILVRHGAYMTEWLVNILSGIVFYCVVGLLWNVNWAEKTKASQFWLEKPQDG